MQEQQKQNPQQQPEQEDKVIPWNPKLYPWQQEALDRISTLPRRIMIQMPSTKNHG